MQYYKVPVNTANYQSSEYSKSYQSWKDIFFVWCTFELTMQKKTENLKSLKNGK